MKARKVWSLVTMCALILTLVSCGVKQQAPADPVMTDAPFSDLGELPSSIEAEEIVQTSQTSTVTSAHSTSHQAVITSQAKKSDKTSTVTSYAKPNQTAELRALWIPYTDINFKGKSESAVFKDIDQKLDRAVNSGMNAVLFHVRPFGDALYHSTVFPASHLLSGTQGKKVSYDVLAYVITAAKKRGLQVHAWINPFRVKYKTTPSKLSADNPAVKNPSLTVTWNEEIYYNPALPQVRKLIIDGVCEIVKNYQVDGIHFDDYFYPTRDANFDKAQYDAYVADRNKANKTPLSLAAWRRSNVDLLVQGVYQAVKAENSKVVFGVSPQANLDNTYNGQCADVYKWGSQSGYVDYLCPQIYFSFAHKTLPFDKAAKQWIALTTNKNVKLYFGLGLYRAGQTFTGDDWTKENDHIKRQIEYSRTTTKCDGFMIYSSRSWLDQRCEQEIKNMMTVFS